MSYLKFELSEGTVGCVRFAGVKLDTNANPSRVTLFADFLYGNSNQFTLCKGIESEYPESKVFELGSNVPEGTTISGIFYQEWNPVTDADGASPEAYNFDAWFNDEKYIIKWATSPDADHDSHLTTEDCDESDPTVYPGAPDICDGKANNRHWNDKEATDKCADLPENYAIDEGCNGDGDGYCAANKNVSLSFLETCSVEEGCCKGTWEWYKQATGKETAKEVYEALLAHDEALKEDAFRDNEKRVRLNKLYWATAKTAGSSPIYMARGNDCKDNNLNIYPGAEERCYNYGTSPNTFDDDCDDGTNGDLLYHWDANETTGVNEGCEDSNYDDCLRYDYYWIGLAGAGYDGECCGNNTYTLDGGHKKPTEFFPYWDDDIKKDGLMEGEYTGCWDSRAVPNDETVAVNLLPMTDYPFSYLSNAATFLLNDEPIDVEYDENNDKMYTFHTNMRLEGDPGGIAKVHYIERNLTCEIAPEDLYKKDDYTGAFEGDFAKMKATRGERTSGATPVMVAGWVGVGEAYVFSYNYTMEFPIDYGWNQVAFTTSIVNNAYLSIKPYAPNPSKIVVCRYPNNVLRDPVANGVVFDHFGDIGKTRKIQMQIACPKLTGDVLPIGYGIGEVGITYKTLCSGVDRDDDKVNVCDDECDPPDMQDKPPVDAGIMVFSGEGWKTKEFTYTPSDENVKQVTLAAGMIGGMDIELKDTSFYRTEYTKVLNVNGTFRGCDIPDAPPGSWMRYQIDTFLPPSPPIPAILPQYYRRHDENPNNCSVESNYYCSYAGHWKRNVDGIASNNISRIPELRTKLELYGYYQGSYMMEQDCCPIGYCWDGITCNNGYFGFVGVHISNVSILNDATGKKELRNYKCVDGIWQNATWKADQDNMTTGYCGEYQCLYRPAEGPSFCVNDGNYTFDDYCIKGTWSSRTGLIAMQLMKLVEGKDYVLFCDSFDNALNDYDYRDVQAGPIVEYLLGNNEGDEETPAYDCGFGEHGCTNNFCVMKYTGDDKKPRVIFGTSLNMPINSNEEGWKDLSFLRLFSQISRNIFPNDDHYTYCDGAIAQQKDAYLGCNGPDTYKKDTDWDVWYNTKTQSVIYSPNEVNLGETTGWNSFVSFLKAPFTATINYILSIPRDKYYRRDYSFLQGLGKFKRLYMNNDYDGSKLRSIKGFVEKVGAETGMVVDYYMVGIDICKKTDEYNIKHCGGYEEEGVPMPKEYIAEICPISCEPTINHDGTWGFHVESNDEDEGIVLWPELTAKIRLEGEVKTTGGLSISPPPVIEAIIAVIPPISEAIGLDAGGSHTCAVINGKIWCWGRNNYGQLGDGTTINRNTPVDVSGIDNAVSVSAGEYYHTCAVLDDGGIKCWGLNGFGQLGDGTTTERHTPVDVSGIDNAVSVSTGEYHTCAVLDDGGIKCWGYNSIGQLGNGGTTAIPVTVPVLVSGIDNAVSVSVGHMHTCAVLNSGGIKCWGLNSFGQLGSGTSNSATPVQVLGISGAVSVSAGYLHTCAVIDDGKIKCWGSNSAGQLGDGTTISPRTAPVQVLGISGAVSVSAGDFHTCAVLNSGGIKCWGNNNFGQLGDGSTSTYKTTPVQVSGISGAVSVSAGTQYTCAVLNDGKMWCWGLNGEGQLGDGTATERHTPVQVNLNRCLTAADADGDGHNSISCGGDDCDDTDPAINPDAQEVCGDYVDSNCDGKECISGSIKILTPITFDATVGDTSRIIAYLWDFSDGNAFGTPYAEEALPVIHTYTSAGGRRIYFRMMDKDFKVYEAYKDITVAPSGSGDPCTKDEDCDNAISKIYCNPLGKCSIQNCTDGWKNQEEVDVDCGGECETVANGNKRCRVGEKCEINSDCMSNVCYWNMCLWVEDACEVGYSGSSSGNCLFSMTNYMNSYAQKGCDGDYNMYCKEYSLSEGGMNVFRLPGTGDTGTVDEPSTSNSGNGAYIAGGRNCIHRAGSCLADEKCIAGISKETGANISSCNDFWDKICCPIPKFYDYFDGTNIDTKKWIITPNVFTIKQKNGKLNLTKGPGGSGSRRAQILSKTVLTGNFVIEMNYTLGIFPVPPTINSWNQLQLEVNDGIKTLLISRQKGGGGDEYGTYSSQTPYTWGVSTNTAGTDSGKMRLKRTMGTLGNTLDAYYSSDGGANWNLIGTTNSISSGPVTFTIALQNNENDQALSVTIDDVVVY